MLKNGPHLKKKIFNMYVYFLTPYKLKGELQNHIFTVHFSLS